MKGKPENNQLMIFFPIAYGITFAMGFFMWYGAAYHMDLNVFPNAQMMYPAAGVMLGFLLFRKKDADLPKWFFRFFLLVTAVMIAIAVLSILLPNELAIVSGTALSAWNLASQYVLIGGSLIGWILLLVAGKNRRKACGLTWKNGKASVACIALFIVLFALRLVISCAISGCLPLIAAVCKNLNIWISLSALAINFFLVYIVFLGEEYGWRYYLQPLLQKKYGVQRGTLILGALWGIWHFPLDFFYYSTETGFPMAAAQMVTCIFLAIFFAWAYMKTQNIWVPVILHFLNNNLSAILSGGSMDAFQNQSVAWGELLPVILINGIVFGGFLFTKPFRLQKP